MRLLTLPLGIILQIKFIGHRQILRKVTENNILLTFETRKYAFETSKAKLI